NVLMTTSTVAAGRFVQNYLPPRVLHSSVPMDLPSAVKRFLDHWRPDLVLWLQSGLWLNLVLATHKRGVPLLWANSQISSRSLGPLQVKLLFLRPMLRAFALCLARDENSARCLSELGAEHVDVAGDLNYAPPPLPADSVALAKLRMQIGLRPVWVAASTHGSEETIVVAAHALISRKHRDLLTIIAPRQPARGLSLARMVGSRGLGVARRRAGEPVTADTNIYIVDTLAELGLFFRVASIAFIGGSLVRKGGHNPFEAARLHCAVLYGPDMSKNIHMATVLNAAGAALTVTDAESLGTAVSRLLDEPTELAARVAAAATVSAECGGGLEVVLQRMAPWLNRLQGE